MEKKKISNREKKNTKVFTFRYKIAGINFHRDMTFVRCDSLRHSYYTESESESESIK